MYWLLSFQPIRRVFNTDALTQLMFKMSTRQPNTFLRNAGVPMNLWRSKTLFHKIWLCLLWARSGYMPCFSHRHWSFPATALIYREFSWHTLFYCVHSSQRAQGELRIVQERMDRCWWHPGKEHSHRITAFWFLDIGPQHFHLLLAYCDLSEVWLTHKCWCWVLRLLNTLQIPVKYLSSWRLGT